MRLLENPRIHHDRFLGRWKKRAGAETGTLVTEEEKKKLPIKLGCLPIVR